MIFLQSNLMKISQFEYVLFAKIICEKKLQ